MDCSLDAVVDDSRWRPETFRDQLAARMERDPRKTSSFFRAALRGCSLDEQTVVWLYYAHEKTMREIAAVLDLSESRVSQMMSAILEGLRKRLDRDDALELLIA